MTKKQLFFCFGPPKSGTTFLQKVLNMHPEVSCPAEHQFDFFFSAYASVLDQYEQVIKQVDHRTGGQGILLNKSSLQKKLLKFTFEEIIFESAKNKTIAGANDNAIINKIDMYNTLFESAKFIAIFRNPIDTAISAWHHNHRLAKEENNPAHITFMTQHGGIEDWIKVICNDFTTSVNNCLNHNKTYHNMLIIRYEDLVTEKHSTLVKLFEFLGAKTDDPTINPLINNSSLDEMKRTAKKKGFFRKGSTDMGKGEITDNFRKEIFNTYGRPLADLGYIL